MKSKKTIVIFTDLDGTLLDEKYQFNETRTIISCLSAMGVKIVLSSSKTKREIEYYREKLGLKDPFISENGAAIFVPKDYFKQSQDFTKHVEQYDVIELGASYSVIRKAFEKLREKYSLAIVGFGDMGIDDIVNASGLTPDLAMLAKKREYSEPFSIEEDLEERVFDAVRKENLSCITGGKYYHLVANHDKGKAVSSLRGMYVQEFGGVFTIGVGDQLNDLSMLQVVDKPILITGKNLYSIWENILKDIIWLNRDCN